MNDRKLLASLEAHCPICGRTLTRDDDGSVTCNHCWREAREKDDYSLMVDFYRKLNVEVWILDKALIDHKHEGQKDE